MAFSLTPRAVTAAQQIVKQPSLAICFEGLDTCYGSSVLIELIRIGDPGLLIDGSWVIGGFREIEDQLNALSLDGSTTSIKQQLDIDKGRGSSISSMEIALVDLGGAITRLISPGVMIDDLMGHKAKILLGFAGNTSFPDDYITIHRGIVDDVKAEQGIIKINVAHPDQKKRSQIFSKFDGELDGAINNSQTTILLATTTQLLQPVLGPDATYDPAFTGYVRIDDEIIKYTGISGNNITGCVRGQLGSVAASHNDEVEVSSFYVLEDNVIDLALKVMMSGWQGSFVENVDVSNFNVLGDASILANSIFFADIDLVEEHGIVIGDYITTTGASNGANNVSLKEVIGVSVNDFGTVLEIDGVTFVNETDSAAVMAIRSQYDVLPSGCRMTGDEVDVSEHLAIQQRFLSSFDVRFYLKESIDNAKEFIELELYKPSGSYSLPRKARASLGFFVGPIPGVNITFLGKDNITNPDKLKIRRTINKNFSNTIIYKFEEAALEDKFLRSNVTISATSLNQIPVGYKALIVESKGMRKDLLGSNNATLISNRKLDRFKFGAEFLEGVEVMFGESFQVEIGDIVMLNGADLNLANTEDGSRDKPERLFEVNNKELNIKTGKVRLDLIDTGFGGYSKYCLVGPSSYVRNGISSTVLIIEASFREEFGINEYKRWDRYTGAAVKVRSADFTTRFGQANIASISGNQITLSASLGFTPQAGDVMELANYSYAGTTEEIRLIYGFQSPLTGGATPYVQL